MSFSFSFRAKKADALARLDAENAPTPAKDYIKLALRAFNDEDTVDVSASGHLWSGPGWSDASSANINISKAPPEA